MRRIVGMKRRPSARSVNQRRVMEGMASKPRSGSLGVSVLSGERYEATFAITFYVDGEMGCLSVEITSTMARRSRGQ